MSQVFEEYIEQYEAERRNWEYIAKKQDYRCTLCGELIVKSEWDIYYLTGDCGYCNGKLEKLKSE